jgi:predicted DCC family thiol-disulfide oxidoreductase YuxK
VLVFDGECGFCTSAARRLGVRAVPWQRLGDDELERLGLTEADARAAAWWVDDQGRSFRGHLAIAHALAAGGGIRAVCGGVLLTPPFRELARGAYPVVARLRHRLPGGTPACRA